MEKQLIARMGKEHSNDFDDKPFLELLFVTKYMNNLISFVICAFLFVMIKWNGSFLHDASKMNIIINFVNLYNLLILFGNVTLEYN